MPIRQLLGVRVVKLAALRHGNLFPVQSRLAELLQVAIAQSSDG